MTNELKEVTVKDNMLIELDLLTQKVTTNRPLRKTKHDWVRMVKGTVDESQLIPQGTAGIVTDIPMPYKKRNGRITGNLAPLSVYVQWDNGDTSKVQLEFLDLPTV